MNFELKPEAKPYHGQALPVPRFHKETIQKEVKRLVKLGVLKHIQESRWAFPSFIIPKKSKVPGKPGTVRVLTDLCELNKRIIRKPYPLPKISTGLQELEGFMYATALDLNIGYTTTVLDFNMDHYTIRLSLTTSEICTIVFPWWKYSYQQLTMGVSNTPDVFQAKIGTLFQDLEYFCAYLDDLLILSSVVFEDHLDKLEQVLQCL